MLFRSNILNYGTSGSLDIASNALSSTANFLKAHGWRAGAGYQPGEVNFAALQAWNAAPVYEQAIAVIGRQIDGGEGTSAERGDVQTVLGALRIVLSLPQGVGRLRRAN